MGISQEQLEKMPSFMSEILILGLKHWIKTGLYQNKWKKFYKRQGIAQILKEELPSAKGDCTRLNKRLEMEIKKQGITRPKY